MEINTQERSASQVRISTVETAEGLRVFMSNVFSWMTVGLVLTGIVSYWFASDASLFSLLHNPEGGNTILGWVVMLAPLGFVIAMGAAFQKLSYQMMMVLFIAFAVVMGMSMSYIFHVYTAGAIYKTFFVTAGTFGIMAFLGYTTKTDLTSFGKYLMMGLIGIILASVVNWFLGSSSLDYIISIMAVLVFTGLTAYDVQRIKGIGSTVENGTSLAGKAAIMGALSLYLDFINLFLMLLRLFGGRD